MLIEISVESNVESALFRCCNSELSSNFEESNGSITIEIEVEVGFSLLVKFPALFGDTQMIELMFWITRRGFQFFYRLPCVSRLAF